MKGIFSKLIAVMLLVFVAAGCGRADSEKEPNDSASNSLRISFQKDGLWTGSISSRSDKDCYSFTVSDQRFENRKLDIRLLHAPEFDLQFEIYRDNRLLKSVDDWAAAGNNGAGRNKGIPVRNEVVERFSNLTLLPGKYLLVVKAGAGFKWKKKIPYRFSVSGGVRTQFMEMEPNDTRNSANPLETGSSLEGWMSPGFAKATVNKGEEDWYRINIQLSNRGLLDVELSGVPGVDLVLEVYAAHGSAPLKRVNANGVHLGERIDKLAVNGNAVYFIRVRAESPLQHNHEIAYSIRTTVTEYQPGMEMEPNDSFSTANPLPMNSESSGLLTPAGDSDYFSFIIPQPGRYMFSARVKGVPDVDLVLSLYDGAGKWIRTFNNVGTGEAEYIVNYGLETAGFDNRYYLRIAAKEGANNRDQYKVYLSLTDANNSSEFEPNDKSASANRLQPDIELRGLIFPKADCDWYKFSLTENRRVRVHLTGIPTVDLALGLYNAKLKRLKTVNKNPVHEGETLSLDLQGPAEYFIKVEARHSWHYNPRETYALKLVTGDPVTLPRGATVSSNTNPPASAD